MTIAQTIYNQYYQAEERSIQLLIELCLAQSVSAGDNPMGNWTQYAFADGSSIDLTIQVNAPE